jgi:hypothetical protein
MKLVRRLVLAALKYNIFFRAKHIPGKHNIVCDLLSRFSFQKARSVSPWLPNPQTNNNSNATFVSVVSTLLRASLSSASTASYNRMIQCYTQFCQTYCKDCPPFQSSLIMLSQFITYLFIRNYSPSSIASYISAIRFVHKSNNLAEPTNSFLIKKILKGAQNLKGKKDTRLPITKDILIKLMNALPFVIQNVDNQLLLKGMFPLAFYAFLRIGEITTKNNLDGSKILQVSNVSFNAEDKDKWSISSDYKLQA